MFPRKKDNWPAWAASYPLLNKLWIKKLLETRGNISEFNSEFQAQIFKVTTRETLSDSGLKVVTINAFLHDSRYYLPCVFPQVCLDSNSPCNGLKEGSFIALKRFSLSYVPISPQRWDPIFRIIDFTHTHGDIPGSQYLPELMNPYYQFVDIKLGSFELSDARRFGPPLTFPPLTNPIDSIELMSSSIEKVSPTSKNTLITDNSQHPLGRVLKLIYPKIMSMKDYLINKRNYRPKAFLQKDDPEEYKTFINTTFVQPDTDDGFFDSLIQSIEPEYVMTLQEVLITVIKWLVEKYKPETFSDYDKTNVLMRGYWKGSKNSEYTNHYPNSILSEIRNSSCWQILFNRIGGCEMAHLLRWTSTFIHLQNDCYYQATGVPCDSLVIKSSQKRSYQVSQDCSSSLSMINLSPQEPARKKKFRLETSSETTINPLKVFQNFPYNNNLSNYSRQRESGKESNTNSFTSSDNNNIRPKKSYNETTVGSSSTSEMNLMSQEPFNKLPRLETLSSKRTDTAEMLKRVYIFYRGPICISAGDKKTVWLGLPPQHVLNQAKRHECNAQDILSVIFPKQFQLYKDPVNEIEVYNKVKKIQDSLTNVKLSEEKETFPAFLASAVVLIEEMIYRHADFQCQKFLRQMCPIDDDAINTGNPKDISCPLDQVSKFVKGVLDRLIPEKFWGRKDNKIAIFKIVDKFLSLGRYESISMHEVLQGYKMKQSKWLPVRDMVKRKAIISEFLKWTFEGLLIPLLRTNFYITDIQNDGHRVYYFRQDIWHKVSDIEIAHFLNNNFEKLECEKIQPLSPTTKASFSSIRLVPKKNGYRPIAKKSFSHINDDLTVKKNQITMNKILLDAFKILALEKERRVEFSNGTVMSTKDVYKRLVDFKKKLPEKRKLYFAKVDVRCCFDSIDQNLLLQIISNLFQSRRYKMIKFTTMSAIGNEYIKTYDKKACPAEDFPCFPLIAERLAESLSHVLFVDGVSYPYREAKEALEFLENHIKQHILKVGDKYYRQKVGIPQGSIISSLLCSFFFEDLEKTKLNFLDKDGVLLRWVDDFLYISTDKAQAIRFLRLMNEGHPEYGCFINPEKTLANFDHEEVKLSPTEFPWCGLLIHTKDLEVKCDYSRTLSTPLRDQMTIMSNISPSTEFQKKLKQFMKKNCSEIFLNTRLNSVATARVNLYQNFLLGAMKFDEYVEELSSRGLKFSDDLVMGIIIDAIKGIYNVIPCEEKSSITWIHKNHAKWLCAHAFWRVHIAKPIKHQYFVNTLKDFYSQLQLTTPEKNWMWSVADLNRSLIFKTKLGF